MQRLEVSFGAHKSVLEKLPSYYVAQGAGGYIVVSVASDYAVRSFATGEDADDFDLHYKAGCSVAGSEDDAQLLGLASYMSKPKGTRQSDGAAKVYIVGREGDERNRASHNFCDPTSWYGSSERVEESLVGSGTSWEGSHQNWVDLTHGKVMHEDAIREEAPHGWGVTITVDGVRKIERSPFATSGGDYMVDYALGEVTSVEDWTGKTVLASYSYATDSVWVMAPSPGKVLDIENCEIQFSTDFEMTGAVVLSFWCLAEAVAPGVFPPGTLIPIPGATRRYDTHQQIIDEAIGAYPVIPASGMPPRGTPTPIYGYPFRYGTVGRLLSSIGMEVHCHTEAHDGGRSTPYGGHRATVTFYATQRDESEVG